VRPTLERFGVWRAGLAPAWSGSSDRMSRAGKLIRAQGSGSAGRPMA
jgi:hypothetical protein